MSGLYYALSIIGLFVIIRWFIRNDGHPDTSGLLAMKSEIGDGLGTESDDSRKTSSRQ